MILSDLLPYSDRPCFKFLQAFIMKTNSRKCYKYVLLGETRLEWQLQ